MANDSILIQVQLGSPTRANINAVTKQIQSALSNVSANVQIQNGRQAAQQLQTIKNKTDSASKSMNSFGEAIGLSGRRFIAFTSAVAVLGRLTSALSQGTREAIKFQREFVKLAQVFDTDVRSLRGLQNSMSDLSREFGLSATVIARTSVVLAQSGLTARQTEQAMAALAKTTLASTFDNLASTTEGAVAIMAQFGTQASLLESQLGGINAVSKKFAVESGDIIEAVRRAGGAFKAAGGNFEDFIALFTAVRSTTRESAETISTGFRTIFARIQRPRTIEFFRELNIELTDGQGNFIGAFEAVRRLSEGLEKAGIQAGSLKFASVVEQLGGIRQVSRVIPLLQEFTKAEIARQVIQEGGASLDADAAKAQETLAQQFARTTENFRALIREISQTATFQAMVKIALDLANALIEVARSLRPLIPLIAAFGAIKLGGLFSGALRKGFGASTQETLLAANRGGPVPNTAAMLKPGGDVGTDTVPALLTPGEFVINKKSAESIGYENLRKLNKYAKGGPVSRVQRFVDGGRIEKDVVRAQGTVLTSIKEAGKVFEDVMGDVAPEIKEIILSTFKGVEEVASGSAVSIDQKKTEFTEGTRGRAVIGGKGTGIGLQIQGEKVAATTETVAHEAGHLADVAIGKTLGGKGRDGKGGKGNQLASNTEGTFQFDVIEKIKPQMQKAMKGAGYSAEQIDKYLGSNEELFAEFFAKASPEVKKILTSTTDSAKGMAELKGHLEKAGSTYGGLEASDIDIKPAEKAAAAKAKKPKPKPTTATEVEKLTAAKRKVDAGTRQARDQGVGQGMIDAAEKALNEAKAAFERIGQRKPGPVAGLGLSPTGSMSAKAQEAEIAKRKKVADELVVARQKELGVVKKGVERLKGQQKASQVLAEKIKKAKTKEIIQTIRGSGPGAPSGPSGPGGRPNKDQQNAQEKATASLDNFAIRMAGVSVLLSQTGLLEPIGKIASRAGDGLSKMLGSIVGGEENVNAFKDALVSGISQLAIFGTALSSLGVDIGGLLKKSFASVGGGDTAIGKLIGTVKGGFGRGRRVGAGLAARGASFGDIIGGSAKSAGNVAAKAGAGKLGKVAAKASGAMGGFTSAVSAAAGPLLLIAGLTFLASKGIQVLSDAYFETAEKQKKVDAAIEAGNIQDAGAAAAELADAQRDAAAATIVGSIAAGAIIGSVIPGLGTAVGALAGAIIGGTIAIVSNLDDFFYNTKAINIAAARTAAALNATAQAAKISSAKNERLFRENKLDEAFANVAKETNDSAKAIKEAQEFTRQAKIGGDEEKIEEAGKRLASAQEAQQKAIQRNLPQIKELIKNQAKQNRGAKSLSEVLDTLPKQQAEQIRQRIKLDKELNGEAADLKEQFQEMVVAGQEVADGLNITALQKNIDDLNKLHSEQFNQQKKINELTGKQTTLGDTRANLGLQAGESIRGLTAAGSSFAGDISTATGLSELNQVISNANSALQQTGDTLHYVNSEGQNEIKTREELNKILATGKIAQKEGIRLVKENSAALVQEITKRKQNIETLNNFVTDFAFSSGKDKRQKTQQFDSAQRVAAGLAAGKTVGEIQGVTQADKQASKALFEQFGDIALFGGKTGKEVLGEARVQEFGGTEGIKKLAEAQGGDAAALEKAIREGALSEQDQMIKDLKQLNDASNSAQQQNIMLFNEGVNIFAKSVLLQAEKAKQDQQVERNKKIEDIKKKAGTDPGVKAAQEDVEASKEALDRAKTREKEEKAFRAKMATSGVGANTFDQIMAAGTVNQKAFESTRVEYDDHGNAYEYTVRESAAEKFDLNERDQQMFRRLQGNEAMGVSSADVVTRRQKELADAQEREKTTRSTLINQRINDAGLSGPAGVSGASALADSVKKSEEDLQTRKEIADKEAETARLNNETENLRQQNNANQPTEITVQTNSSLQVNGIDNDLANKVADAARPVVENVASDSVIAGINIMEVGGDVPPRGHGVLLGSTR